MTDAERVARMLIGADILHRGNCACSMRITETCESLRQSTAARVAAALRARDEEIGRRKARNDTAETVLASATDIGNSWAREACVMEARTTYEIGALIDRLWAGISRDHNKLREQRDRLAEEIARLRADLKAMQECALQRAGWQEEAQQERDRLAERVKEETAIVDRVWNALGISTFEQADGRTIDEHVRALAERVLLLGGLLEDYRDGFR
jgi:hypothetical protein